MVRPDKIHQHAESQPGSQRCACGAKLNVGMIWTIPRFAATAAALAEYDRVIAEAWDGVVEHPHYGLIGCALAVEATALESLISVLAEEYQNPSYCSQIRGILSNPHGFAAVRRLVAKDEGQ